MGGAYRIERQIGSGGMGAVFAATDERSGTQVALKWVLPGPDHARSRDRLVREWHLARQVRHENVVDILDFGEEEGSTYLVMELLEGDSLESWVSRGPFQAERAISVLMPVFSGVAAAHASGIVHRDLKPQNVILRPSQHGLRPTIIDFGISRAAAMGVYGDRKLTAHGIMVGTPLYMSPEQLMGEERADPRVDIYALGVILFELLCGAPPFHTAVDDAQILMEKIDRPPMRLSQLLPDVDPKLESVVAKALERSPSRRWKSIEAFARALEPFCEVRFANGDPHYRGPGPHETRGTTLRVRRQAAPLSRLPMLIALGASAGAILVLGLCGGVYLATRQDPAISVTPLPPTPRARRREAPPPEPEASEPPAAPTPERHDVVDSEPPANPLAAAPEPEPVPEPVEEDEGGSAAEPAVLPAGARVRPRPRPVRRAPVEPRPRPGRRGRSGRMSVDDF